MDMPGRVERLVLGFVNAYALETPDGWLLVDTGTPGSGPRIERFLARLGVAIGDLRGILITHSDYDHIGSLSWLYQHGATCLYAHEAELPLVAGRARPAPALKAAVSRLVAHPPAHAIRPLQDGDNVFGVRVLHTPGHTVGHACYLYERYAFLGDLLWNVWALAELPRPMMLDRTMARHSIERMASVGFEVGLPGHGRPFQCDRTQLCRLADSWARSRPLAVARPG